MRLSILRWARTFVTVLNYDHSKNLGVAAMSQSTTEIPVVDLRDISSPRSEVRERAAAQIREG